MKEENFEIELSEYSLDMKNIYSYMTAQYKEDTDNCPMLAVVKELPEQKASYLLKDRKGITRVILLREAAAPVMLSNLYEACTMKQDFDSFPADCAFYYDKNEVYNLYVMALSICDALNICCPQIIYTKNMPLEGYKSLTAEDFFGNTNTLFLNQFSDFSRTIAALAYELRHVWQHEKHERVYFTNYKPFDPSAGEEEQHAFQLQKAEIDAEAFSLRFLEHVLDAVVRSGKNFADVNDAINAKAQKLAVPF